MRNEVARGAATGAAVTREGKPPSRSASRRKRPRWRGEERELSQREVLRDVMLSANQCGAWLTLRELSMVTRYGEASISAQLRHFRKEEFGAYVVEKRVRRSEAEPLRSHGAVWEYRMSPRVRVVCGRTLRRERRPRGARVAARVVY
jgi:hypothetical protein